MTRDEEACCELMLFSIGAKMLLEPKFNPAFQGWVASITIQDFSASEAELIVKKAFHGHGYTITNAVRDLLRSVRAWDGWEKERKRREKP